MYALASYLASNEENSVYMLFVSERTPDRGAMLDLKQEMGIDYLEHLSGLHSLNAVEVDGTGFKANTNTMRMSTTKTLSWFDYARGGD